MAIMVIWKRVLKILIYRKSIIYSEGYVRCLSVVREVVVWPSRRVR